MAIQAVLDLADFQVAQVLVDLVDALAFQEHQDIVVTQELVVFLELVE